MSITILAPACTPRLKGVNLRQTSKSAWIIILVTKDLPTKRFRYGHSLVQFDPKAEAKLRLKIDMMVVPTVAILYLFCFIDRANIGKLPVNLFEVSPIIVSH